MVCDRNVGGAARRSGRFSSVSLCLHHYHLILPNNSHNNGYKRSQLVRQHNCKLLNGRKHTNKQHILHTSHLFSAHTKILRNFKDGDRRNQTVFDAHPGELISLPSMFHSCSKTGKSDWPTGESTPDSLTLRA